MINLQNINLYTGIYSIAGGIITAWLTYKIFLFNRIGRGWLAVMWAFIFMALRRALGFMSDFNILPDYKTYFKFTEYIILVIITTCLLYGFYAMLKNFEGFDIVERKVQSKLRRKK